MLVYDKHDTDWAQYARLATREAAVAQSARSAIYHSPAPYLPTSLTPLPYTFVKQRKQNKFTFTSILDGLCHPAGASTCIHPSSPVCWQWNPVLLTPWSYAIWLCINNRPHNKPSTPAKTLQLIRNTYMNMHARMSRYTITWAAMTTFRALKSSLKAHERRLPKYLLR